MKYDPDVHHRRSIRFEGYDYRQTGAYFMTICTQNREYLFGDIADGEMVLNDAGQMVEKWWNKLPEKFDIVRIDAYVVMPNHFHGVITITNNTVGANPCIRPNIDKYGMTYNHRTTGERTNTDIKGENVVSPLQGLGQYISWFKRMSTNEYIRGVKQNAWPPFPGKLWQRNYYEHIIRNENELHRVQKYIINNPMKWALDRENPDIVGAGLKPAPTGCDKPWEI